MKISPRKTEVTAVVELLKNGEFESPEQGARAVISLVAELLGRRSWWAYRLSTPGLPRLTYGPFATTTKLKEFAEELALGPGGAFMIHAPAAALESKARADFKPSPFCVECGHPVDAHGVLPRTKEACTIMGCECEAPISGGNSA